MCHTARAYHILCVDQLTIVAMLIVSALLPRWFVVHVNAQEVALMSVSLRSLSDKDILSRTLELTRRERSATLGVLQHLNEIERRKLHLTQGYSSLFDYCTHALGYSEPAAVRRIRAARCVARFPEVLGMLEANEVNLSTIARISRVLNAGNKTLLLARIRGRSQREVDRIRAEYQPGAMMPDRVRPLVVAVAAAPRAPAAGLGVSAPAGDACEKSAYRRSDGAPAAPPDRPACPGETCGTTTFEHRLVIRFTASEVFMEKAEKIKSLASHKLSPNPSFEQAFELAMDAYLEKHDPSARRERRRAIEQSPAGDAGSREQRPRKDPTAHTRYVPARVRDQVFLRDRGQCAYVSPGGRRCGSSFVLQIDHVKPVAHGGANTPDNLRLLCAYHNRLEAERIVGTAAGLHAT
ncbi:MAG TPA: HNH endonuclease signature motif containing protein [Candidatus Krumholzibacteria bacterium]|nr:HNH endonuclease signature motif containing protein [Candidatus Krumholzibacteria bacterium]